MAAVPPAPPRKSNAVKIILIVLGVVVRLCTGIVGVAAFLRDARRNAEEHQRRTATARGLAGVSGLIADPEAELDEAIKSSGADMTLSNVESVHAGPQGGSARCGDGEVEEIKVGFCVWASRGSLVMYVVYFSTGEEAAAELVGIRAAVEQKK